MSYEGRVGPADQLVSWTSSEDSKEDKSADLIVNFQVMALLVNEKGETSGKKLNVGPKGRLVEDASWSAWYNGTNRGTLLQVSLVMQESWDKLFICLNKNDLPELPDGENWEDLIEKSYKAIKILGKENADCVSMLRELQSTIETEMKSNLQLQMLVSDKLVTQLRIEETTKQLGRVVHQLGGELKKGVSLKKAPKNSPKVSEESSLLKVHETFMKQIGDVPTDETLNQDWTVMNLTEELPVEHKIKTTPRSPEFKGWYMISSDDKKPAPTGNELIDENDALAAEIDLTKDDDFRKTLALRNQQVAKSILLEDNQQFFEDD